MLLASSGTAWADDGAADAPVVEELIVTGEKTERTLQDTVASVAVVTSRRIERENIQDFFDLVARTANVSETYGGSGFTIRGINNTNVSGGGNGGLTTVYVDGAPMADRILHGGPLQMWDVQQVEILRGPQSTLQGRNALAGAVVIRTKDPTFSWSGAARAIYTDENEHVLSIAGGGPIISDQLAFRLALEDRKSDGFTRNVTLDQQEDPTDATTIRGKLLITPANLPGLQVRAGWTHDERTGGYIFSYARTDVPDAYDNRVSAGDYPNRSRTKTDIVTLAADYEISDGFDLSSVTAWSKTRNRSQYDGDATAAPLSFGDTDDRDESLTQELRLTYSGDKLTGLVGAYASKRDISIGTFSLTNVPTPVGTLVGVLRGAPFNLPLATATLAANTYAAALPNILVDYDGVTPQEVETVALFADGRYQLTDKLSVLAGFRYDRETNTLSTDTVTSFAGTYPNPALYGSLAPVIGGLNQVVAIFVAQAGAVTPEGTRTFEAFLPKLGLKYDMTEDASVSFVVQRGYRSGGSVVNVARAQVVPFDPEYTWNYELALRTSWLDDTLTVNANAYYVKWKDQQVSVNLGLNLYDYQTENAGKSHLYGFELETAYRPNANFEAYASLGYSRTKFDDFVVTGAALPLDLSGSEFAFAPHWTWAAGGDYRWDNGVFVNLNASYRADAFSDTGVNQANFALDARTIVNGRIGYGTERWTVSAFTNNIFDEAYILYNQANMARAMFGEPRVIGAMLEARW